MALDMKDSYRMIWEMEAEYITIQIKMYMLAIGRMINIMEKDVLYSNLVKDIKEAWRMESKKVREFIIMPMETVILDNGLEIKSKEQVYLLIYNKEKLMTVTTNRKEGTLNCFVLIGNWTNG